MAAGKKRFRVFLQTNYLRTIVVFHTAGSYNINVHFYFWKFGGNIYRWSTKAIVLYGRYHCMELLCRMPYKNIHCL